MEALRRAMSILETFRSGGHTRTVDEIAQASGIPLSTTYRYVSEMVSLGLLTHSARERDGYSIGVALTDLMAGGDPHRELGRIARPHLVDLQRVTGQHTQLAVLEGENVVYVEKLSATRAVQNITDVGRRMPACLNSSGILLLAEEGVERAEDALDAEKIGAYIETLPDNTTARVPSRSDVRSAATNARRKGYCELDSWLAPKISGLSAPVRNADGKVIAAVSVIMPNDRAAIRRVVPLLRFTGINISRALVAASRTSDGSVSGQVGVQSKHKLKGA